MESRIKTSFNLKRIKSKYLILMILSYNSFTNENKFLLFGISHSSRHLLVNNCKLIERMLFTQEHVHINLPNDSAMLLNKYIRQAQLSITIDHFYWLKFLTEIKVKIPSLVIEELILNRPISADDIYLINKAL